MGMDGNTGRASNALIYRNSLLGFDVGIQAQVLSDRLGLDAAAVSLRYTAPFGLSIAGAYTHSYFGALLREQLGFPRPIGASRIAIFGLGYQGGGFAVDMVYARSWNHEVAFADGEPKIVFDADGVELLASWVYRPRRRDLAKRDRLRVVAGYNGRYPRGGAVGVRLFAA